MYKGFYGLREKPFSKTPDPRFLYLSGGHEEALARLQYAVEERELALLTGGIGSGKTTISRALMDCMGDGYRFCFIFNPILTPVEFLRVLAWNLGVESPPAAKDDLLRELTGQMYRCHADGIVPVVVVDEAQMIPGREVFDEIRLLTNYQLDDGNLLAVILMGQPELRRKLADPVYEPLCQRIGIHYHLGPLSLEETLEYVDFRLGVAGGAPGLFSPDAVMKIHELTGGVPRRINSMATAALLEGFARDVTLIEGEIIEALSEEIDVHGTGSAHDEPC
jgi:type II secretory pathway predicted ATPase ExeA